MRRMLVALASLSLVACAAGPPESDSDLRQTEGALGAAQEADGPALQRAGDPAAAVAQSTAVDQALVSAGPTCDTMCLAKQWVGEERYAEAREALGKRLEGDPSDVAAALALTSVDLLDEEYAAAYDRSHAWSEVRPEDVRWLEKRAAASLMSHDVATAVEDYHALIHTLQRSAPDAKVCGVLMSGCRTVAASEARAWMNLATAHYNQGNLDEAEGIVDDLAAAKDLEGRLDPAYSAFIRALVAAKRGDDAKAMDHYRSILARYPNHSGTLNNVGGIYYRAGDLATARTYFERAYENAGTYRRGAAIAWSNVAEVDMLQGDYAAAEEKLLETIATSKQFAAGHFNLGILYDLMGKRDLSDRHLALGLRYDVQGVTRWNTSYFTPEWQTHFEALLADQTGKSRKAASLWSKLRQSRIEALRATADRHLESGCGH